MIFLDAVGQLIQSLLRDLFAEQPPPLIDQENVILFSASSPSAGI